MLRVDANRVLKLVMLDGKEDINLTGQSGDH